MPVIKNETRSQPASPVVNQQEVFPERNGELLEIPKSTLPAITLNDYNVKQLANEVQKQAQNQVKLLGSDSETGSTICSLLELVNFLMGKAYPKQQVEQGNNNLAQLIPVSENPAPSVGSSVVDSRQKVVEIQQAPETKKPKSSPNIVCIDVSSEDENGQEAAKRKETSDRKEAQRRKETSNRKEAEKRKETSNQEEVEATSESKKRRISPNVSPPELPKTNADNDQEIEQESKAINNRQEVRKNPSPSSKHSSSSSRHSSFRTDSSQRRQADLSSHSNDQAYDTFSSSRNSSTRSRHHLSRQENNERRHKKVYSRPYRRFDNNRYQSEERPKIRSTGRENQQPYPGVEPMKYKQIVKPELDISLNDQLLLPWKDDSKERRTQPSYSRQNTPERKSNRPVSKRRQVSKDSRSTKNFNQRSNQPQKVNEYVERLSNMHVVPTFNKAPIKSNSNEKNDKPNQLSAVSPKSSSDDSDNIQWTNEEIAFYRNVVRRLNAATTQAARQEIIDELRSTNKFMPFLKFKNRYKNQ